jgi:hypothetical protein
MASQKPGSHATRFLSLVPLESAGICREIRNVERLRQRIIEACNAITPSIIKRVFVDWVKRLNLCTKNNGGHIQQVL